MQFPDVTPFLKYGTVGVLLFIVLAVLGVGAYAAVKVALALIQKLNNGNGIVKSSALADEQSHKLRDAQRQLDELKAGNKPVQFWVDAYENSAVKAMAPMMQKLDELLASQRTILNAMKRARIKDDDTE